ncbi:MAG: hypothetical protein ACREIJ_02890, partial [Nitrospiraceae bacterium]
SVSSLRFNSKMFLQLNENEFGGLCPPASFRLSGELGLPLFNRDHGLRHPLGIYNVSLGKIEERFKKVLNELEPFLKVENAEQIKDNLFPPLLDAQERLLFSLEEHFDDCYSILDCFFPNTSVRKKNAQVKLFVKRMETYSDLIGEIVNKMKHKNARLRGIILSLGTQVVPGYFLEGVHPDGALGPDLHIHKGSGGLTAFSFFRDLRLHFVSLFATSEYLTKAIDHLGDKGSSDARLTCSWAAELGKTLASLPETYYPNEIKPRNPWILYNEEQDERIRLTLSIGEKSPKPKTFVHGPGIPSFAVRAIYSGDSVTKSFKIPYSGTVQA